MTRLTTDLPDDGTLTRSGADLHTKGKILIVACGALAREILMIRDANGWSHMDLTCLPAIYHLYPEKITDAVREAVAKHRDAYDAIYIGYGDCGTGGELETTCEDLGVELVAGPHCYSFFQGNEDFAERDEMTVFFLTDFLVRQFDAFVWKPLGLDRHPELRDMYFGNYDKLVYQAQIDDPGLTVKAEACAKRLGLPFERRFTGFGDLKSTMGAWAKGS